MSMDTVRQAAYALEIVLLLILALIYVEATLRHEDVLVRRLRWSWVAFLLALAFMLSWQAYGAFANVAAGSPEWQRVLTVAVLALNVATANVIARFLDFRQGEDER